MHSLTRTLAAALLATLTLAAAGTLAAAPPAHAAKPPPEAADVAEPAPAAHLIPPAKPAAASAPAVATTTWSEDYVQAGMSAMGTQSRTAVIDAFSQMSRQHVASEVQLATLRADLSKAFTAALPRLTAADCALVRRVIEGAR